MSADFSPPGRPHANAEAGDGRRAEYGEAVIVDALVEMTHAQGEDVTQHHATSWVTLVRRTPFLRIVGTADGGADLQFFYPAVPPDDSRLTALIAPTALTAPVPTGATHHLHMDPATLDADLIALEPLIEAAYAQNG